MRTVRDARAGRGKLDDLADGIVTPVTVKRGLMARLHYLPRTDHSRRAARDAGLTVTDRTLKAWLEGRRRPSNANLERIDAVYRQVRRQNTLPGTSCDA